MGEEIREIGLGMGQLLLIRPSTGKIGLSAPDFLNKCAHVSLEMAAIFNTLNSIDIRLEPSPHL